MSMSPALLPVPFFPFQQIPELIAETTGKVSVCCINQRYQCITVPWFVVGSVWLFGGSNLVSILWINPGGNTMHGCTPGSLLKKFTYGHGYLLGQSHVWWKVCQASLFRTKKQIIRQKMMFCLSSNFLSLCSNSCKAQESMFKWSNCKYHSLVTYFPLSLVKCDF